MLGLRPTVCGIALVCAVVVVVGVYAATDGSEPVLCLVADFEGATCSRNTATVHVPPVLGYGAFYGGPSNHSTAEVGCVADLQSAQTHSQVARVEYDVSRLGSYSGLWLQWSIRDFDIAQWDTVSFDLRGCDASIPGDCHGHGASYTGFTTRLKVELKIKGWGWRVAYIDALTAKWQRIEIPLADFDDTMWTMGTTNEFVLTFEQREATAARGMVYLDNISFERRQKDQEEAGG